MGEKGSERRGGGRIPAISGTPPVRWPESSGDLRKEKAFAPASVSPFSCLPCHPSSVSQGHPGQVSLRYSFICSTFLSGSLNT